MDACRWSRREAVDQEQVQQARLHPPHPNAVQASLEWTQYETPWSHRHNFFAQFGRVFQPFDQSVRHDLAWIEMAAYVVLLRSGFVS